MLSRTFWVAMFTNCLALSLVSILTAIDVLPDNWIISPIYILLCSFAHKLFFRLDLKLLLAIQVATFATFPFINWCVISIILRYATI